MPMLTFPPCLIIWRALDHLDILQNIMWVHHVDDVMLIRPDEQKVVHMLEVLTRQMSSREWEINLLKLLKLGPNHISEDLRDPVNWGMLRHLQNKRQLIAFHLTTKKGLPCLISLLRVWGSMFCTWGYPLTGWYRRLPALSGAQSSEELCSKSRLWWQRPCGLGYMA